MPIWFRIAAWFFESALLCCFIVADKVCQQLGSPKALKSTFDLYDPADEDSGAFFVVK